MARNLKRRGANGNENGKSVQRQRETGIIQVISEQRKEINILDTCVLIHEPRCFETLREKEKDAQIVVPWVVTEELDKKKSDPDIGRDSREASAQIELDQLGEKYIQIIKPKKLIRNLSSKIADYEIIATGLELQKKNKDSHVVVMSLDTNFRIWARQLGLTAIEYPYTQTDATFDPTFKRFRAPSNGNFHKENGLVFFRYAPSLLGALAPNEGVICDSGEEESDLPFGADRTFLAIYKGDGCFRLVQEERDILGLRPRTLEELMNSNSDVASNQEVVPSKKNKKERRKQKRKKKDEESVEQVCSSNGRKNWHQHLALEHLTDPNIELVFLQGGAGTGKTLFSIAAAIFQKERYEQIIIVRPAVHVGGHDSHGFLPGNLEEKMNPWLAPVRQAYYRLYKINPSLKKVVSRMKEQGKIIYESLDFIRGQTFDKSLIIIDDAQNLTRHQTKSIITRAGFDTKMVFTGDLGQIDDRFLTPRNSGLTHAMSEMKEPEFASVNFEETVRSHLASRAEKLL